MNKNTKLLRNVVIIVLISIVAYTLINLLLTDKEDLAQLANFRIGYLFLAGIASLMPWLMHALEMMLWTQYLNNRLSLKDALNISIATDLGSAATPTVVGGTPVKVGMLLQKGYTIPQTTFVTGILSVEDFLSFIIIITSSLIIFSGEQAEVFVSIKESFFTNWEMKVAIIVGSFILLYIFWRLIVKSKRVSQSDFKQKFVRAWFETKELIVQTWASGKTYLILGTLFILTRWLFRFSILVFLALGLQIEVDYMALFFLQWITFVSMLVMPTPGAAGGAELVFYYVFGGIVPEKLIGIVMTGWRFFNYYFIMLVAAFILIFQMILNKVKNG